MEIINKGDKKVVGIVSKKNISENVIFRTSCFVYPYAESGVYLLKNTLTGQVARLSEKEFEAFEKLIISAKDYSYLAANGLTELARLRFIVENDYSEEAHYKQIADILNIMRPEKAGFETYTILPTTGCNARCVYCYEQGIKANTMSLKTADRLIDYICETRCTDEIKISWFGGEPLLAHEMISYICEALKAKGVPFRSKIITNASLLTRELAHTAKTLWNLKKAQVSLDGMPADYEERKCYYLPEKYNHKTVVKAIHYLDDEGIEVRLRINFDRNNISRIKPYLDYLKSEFADSENISVYPGLLFQEKHAEKCVELYREMFELKKYIKQIGLHPRSKDNKKTHMKLNYCMADSMDSSIVIDPQGNFYNCEHLPENQTWGNIFDGCTDTELFERLKNQAETDDQCRGCTFLPYCTPFYKKSCPGWFAHCREYMQMKTANSLGNIADKIIKETQEQKNDGHI